MEESSQFTIHSSQFTLGFTLIELLFVFSVFAVLSTIGVASFVTYSRTQTLSAATFDLSTMFNVAKSRASSQVKPSSCGVNVLDGYKVTICGLAQSACPTVSMYQLRVICGTTETVISAKKLPSSIQFDSDVAKTTSVSYFFKTLTGGVDGSGKVTLRGYGNAKSVIIDTSGNIHVQ